MRLTFYKAVLLPLIGSNAANVATWLEAFAEPHSESITENQSDAAVDLDCLNDLLADCHNGVEAACDEILGKHTPCLKKSATAQPSFKAPAQNAAEKSDPPKVQFTHSERKQLDHIDGDCMPYQGNHVFKVPLKKTVIGPPAKPPMPSPLKQEILNKIQEAIKKKQMDASSCQKKPPMPAVPTVVRRISAPTMTLLPPRLNKSMPIVKPPTCNAPPKPPVV